VSSYLTVSPLRSPHGEFAVCSLLHFPWGFPPWELPSALPCGVRTFLQHVKHAPATASPTLARRKPNLKLSRDQLLQNHPIIRLIVSEVEL